MKRTSLAAALAAATIAFGGAITAPQAQAAPPPHVQERKAAKAKKKAHQRVCATQDLTVTDANFWTAPAPVLCTEGYPAELETNFIGNTTAARWFDIDLHLERDGYFYVMYGSQQVGWVDGQQSIWYVADSSLEGPQRLAVYDQRGRMVGWQWLEFIAA